MWLSLAGSAHESWPYLEVHEQPAERRVHFATKKEEAFNKLTLHADTNDLQVTALALLACKFEDSPVHYVVVTIH